MTTTDFFFCFLAKIFWGFFFLTFFCAQPFPYFASSDSLEVFFLFITCDNFLHKYLHSMTIKLAASDGMYSGPKMAKIVQYSSGKQALFIREGFISKNMESILCTFFHIFKALLWWQKRIQTQCPLYLFYASWAIGNCLVLFDSWLSKLYIFVYLINIYRCIHPFQQAFILEYRTKKKYLK